MDYQYVIYKPKRTFDGVAANFQVSQNGCFLTLAKQKQNVGDNASFDWKDENGKSRHCIKLDLPDIGSFMALFSGRLLEAKIYHEYPKTGANKVVTSINASLYKDKDGNYKGYSVNITRGGVKLGFGLSFQEAEVLKALFNEAIMCLCVVKIEKKAVA